MENKKHQFTVEKLIKYLSVMNPKAEVVVSSDEELNQLYNGFEVTYLENETGKDQVVIFPLSGFEIEE